MKTIQVMIVMLGLATASCAQDIPQNAVPSVVLNAFGAKYPNATDVDWEKKGEVYNVGFEIGKTDHEAWFDAAGKVIKVETDISKKELPAAVQSAIAKHYAGYRTDDADKIEKDGKTYYKVELDGNMGDRTVVFDAQGTEMTDTKFLY